MKGSTLRYWGKKLRATVVPVALRLGRPLVWLRRRLKPHKVRMYAVESAAGDAPPLSIRCGLSGQTKHYFLGVALDGPARESNPGVFRLLDIFRPGWASDASMIVVDTNQAHFNWLKRDGWFFLPVWIRGEVTFPIPEKFMIYSSVKSDLRLIRRHQFEYEITHDEARFKDFYHHMHVPHIHKTFGDAAYYDTYAEQRRQCEDYDLLLVHKKDQPGQDIAGVLIVYEPERPRMWSLGVRDDGVDHVHEGAIAALYHFTFEHIAARGFKRLSLGGSRAFLGDGVLNFKRKMSQTLMDPSWQGFALKITSLTPGVRNFLLKNPFIFQKDGQLCAAVFVDEPLSLEIIQKIEKRFFHPGLSRLVIHTFCVEEKFQVSSLPPPMAGHIEIRQATEIIGQV